MKLSKEQLKEIDRLKKSIGDNQFFNNLGLLGESFIEFMKEEEEMDLMNSYLDYINWCKEEGLEHHPYPVYCFMAMSKTIIQMHADGEIKLR